MVNLSGPAMFVIMIMVLGIVIGISGQINTNFGNALGTGNCVEGNRTDCSIAANVSYLALDGNEQFGLQLPTIGIIVAAIVILGFIAVLMVF